MPRRRRLTIKIVPPSTPSARRWNISTKGNNHTELRIPWPKHELSAHSQNDIRSELRDIPGEPPYGGGREYAIARPAATIATHNTRETTAAALALSGVSASISHSAILRPTVALNSQTFNPANKSISILTLKKILL